MAEVPVVRVHLLGALRIEIDGSDVRLSRRKVESLLAWLLLHPRGQTRDYLAALFWGDSNDAQARHSLRTALATLRSELGSELGSDLLLADRESVRLNPEAPLWVDLHSILALEKDAEGASNEQIEAALGLWQGSLLSGFYDEWVDAEREHYNARLNMLFLKLTQVLRSRSAYRQAISAAQRILQHDIANEEAHQHLIFCYVALGDRAAALRQYEACARALRDELDAEPAPETVALYDWIRQQEGDGGSAAARITNLPIPLTTFIGRTRESAEVKRLLAPVGKLPVGNLPVGELATESRAPVRLLTLMGPGGSGKTRLAIHAATDLIDSFADGVWWVELAALEESDAVARAVAKTLGVVERAGAPLIESLASAIGTRQMLLALDNCEHLVTACAQVAANLLERCPNLQLLATSREALNVSGEMLWRVPTFSVPQPNGLDLLDLLMQYESIRLFVERARAVRSDFVLTHKNAPSVVQICARLDGIPLAIELAAARVRLLGVEEIAEYLNGAIGARFALLTQGARTVLPRHQTLRATIDWSYDLLDEGEQILFRQAAVFQGGFTLQRLQEVVHRLAPAQKNGIKLLDALGQLVDKSLVVAETARTGESALHNGHGTDNSGTDNSGTDNSGTDSNGTGAQSRYRMLETLREYALERYPSEGAFEAMQRAHAQRYLEIAEDASKEMLRAEQRTWVNLLEGDHANLRAALRYQINAGHGNESLRLATALQRFWEIRGYAAEGLQWLREALLLRDGVDAEIVGKALNSAGWLAYRLGQLDDARAMHEDALRLFEQAEDEVGAADSMRLIASMQLEMGEYDSARNLMNQALALFTEAGDQLGMALTYALIGHLHWDLDQFGEAARHHATALALQRKLGNHVSVAFESLAMGDVRRMMKMYDESQRHYEECLEIATSLGHKGLTGGVYKSLGMLAVRRGRFDEAQEYGEFALKTFRELGDRAHIGFSYSHLGDVARNLGNGETALHYYIQYLHSMASVGIRWATFNALENVAWMLAELKREPEVAARLIGRANAMREQMGIPGTEYEAEKIGGILEWLAAQLGAENLAVERTTGRAMTVSEAVAAAQALQK